MTDILNTHISRRQFLGAGVAAGLAALAAVFDPDQVWANRVDSIPSHPEMLPPVAATETPPVVIEVGEVRMQGIPKEVNPEVVDSAKGDFINKTGVAPHIFADPGGLLVGPDFGYTGTGNPWSASPEGWKTMYEANGGIQPFSPVTQEVVRWSGEAYQNLPEGGFGIYTGGQMTVTIGDAVIEMPPQGPGHIYMFAARGLYPDGKQDTDHNTTVQITDYRPGHLQLLMYQSRQKTGLAFISEDQFLQMVATAHTMGTNCGAEGCSKLTLVAYDSNTGAMEILSHSQGRSLDVAKAKENWRVFFSNWRTF
ncbi:MAG: hypothetical protein UX99_C0019G0018 [Candidatus Amesbacteria bacterium GW2011_GWB1_47_26]|uniref:Twin-arginine translocation signal domain-containing protein n=1 Tax=Candidatus Amesbacteria bacterium GW2011_GWC2_45_19 TaxID=1618366 RepID=A0A0G1M265_9BACT|nr:MAG: hypothetical protein UX05_C0015G0030 [Candidatus Amesbacteria bacterium GW2011_GWC2_45_19]KKU38226.1 MAG: hypothetical protein UX52_C0009G0033 [Candidatus Amesbacteria bacterium GW2011_GWA1_46_35]KKU68147.1 MAG: hypothetical protein UX93_C0010G0002 [Microgenomates group bacterium GW2011_GWC1_47_20]KKU74278.1 MAG: hypothetical protein UX99_C0019G0018 [Candidatus Amesbacteria bacterium GW2011_GWB1_47_26]KKU79277.1 MAG: hypothetical protein UY06_C0026G0004 [Candidatus Amesbacteria bacteriu